MEEAEIKKEFNKGRSGRKYGFKKKGSGKFNKKQQSSMADEFFKGVGLCVGREGPELYIKTIERLGLYASTQFKNGSNVKKRLMKGKLVKPCTVLAEKHTPNDKIVWEYCIGELIKTKRVLEGNLCNLFAILMSLYDPDMKNQVESSTEYAKVK